MAVALGGSAFAQTEKGRWLVGAQVGEFSYRIYKNNSGHYFSVNLTPSAGYFIANNLLVAAVLPFDVNTQNVNYGPSFYNRSIGIGPSIQYYVGNRRLKPYFGIGYTYSRSYTKWTNLGGIDPESITKSYVGNLTPTAGIAYFINRNALVTAGFNYNIQHNGQETYSPSRPTTVTNSYAENFKSLSLGIRFALLFGK
ncbi:hypothetical protein GCM10027347_53460 [Larkinella harenae]